MKTNILLALVALMSTGCFSAHAHVTPSVVLAPPPPAQPAVVITPASVSIQWHYVYVNTAWVRRSGPPPRGAVYHAHPRHRNSVIVHRSSGHRNHAHRGHAHRPAPRNAEGRNRVQHRGGQIPRAPHDGTLYQQPTRHLPVRRKLVLSRVIRNFLLSFIPLVLIWLCDAEYSSAM